MLAHAVRRGRGPEFLRLLAEHGAELDRPGGETWRGDVPLRTPYQHAVLRGRADSAETLAELGASTEVAPDDLSVAAVAAGDRPPAPLPDVLDPDAQEVLILAALRGRLDAVVDAVGVDFSGVVGGSPEGTLLHHAAWVGNPEWSRALLERGADPLAASPEQPLAWAVHGSQFWERAGPRPRRRRGAPGCCRRSGRAALPGVRGRPAVRVAREPARARAAELRLARVGRRHPSVHRGAASGVARLGGVPSIGLAVPLGRRPRWRRRSSPS